MLLCPYFFPSYHRLTMYTITGTRCTIIRGRIINFSRKLSKKSYCPQKYLSSQHKSADWQNYINHNLSFNSTVPQMCLQLTMPSAPRMNQVGLDRNTQRVNSGLAATSMSPTWTGQLYLSLHKPILRKIYQWDQANIQKLKKEPVRGDHWYADQHAPPGCGL